jgi:hypothetical protein
MQSSELMVVVFIFQETNGLILAVVSESACLFSFIVAPTQTCADDVAEPGFKDFSHKPASRAHTGNERREPHQYACVRGPV